MKPNRREFFKRSAAAGALVSIPYGWAYAKTSAARGGDKPTVAAIGVGGSRGAFNQGGAIAMRASQLGQMVAVCDVDAIHAAEFNNRFDNKLVMYGDYRQLLEREKPEIVTIGTPDHWHVPIAIAALRSRLRCVLRKAAHAHDRRGHPHSQGRQETRARCFRSARNSAAKTTTGF